MTPSPTFRASLALTMLTLATLPGARADGGPLMPAKVPPAYVQECAACHTAYPPGMLPRQSWQRIMTGLDKHYGTDASIDAATVQQLSTWLQANAGTYKRVAQEPPQDRITRSAWFEREHRKVDPQVWKHASVKSAANCAACHTGADKGNFNENQLQVPKGLDPRLQKAWND